jgi:hypothetical protein
MSDAQIDAASVENFSESRNIVEQSACQIVDRFLAIPTQNPD